VTTPLPGGFSIKPFVKRFALRRLTTPSSRFPFSIKPFLKRFAVKPFFEKAGWKGLQK
jgi:hypothetical protein